MSPHIPCLTILRAPRRTSPLSVARSFSARSGGGGTERGNEVLAHLGAITELPMAANCTQAVDNGSGAYAIVRQRWAGLLLEEAVLQAPAALLTVATDAVAPVPAETVATVRSITSRRRWTGAT